MVTCVDACGRFGLGWRKRRNTTCAERMNEFTLEGVSAAEAACKHPSSRRHRAHQKRDGLAGDALETLASDDCFTALSAEWVDAFANADS